MNYLNNLLFIIIIVFLFISGCIDNTTENNSLHSRFFVTLIETQYYQGEIISGGPVNFTKDMPTPSIFGLPPTDVTFNDSLILLYGHNYVYDSPLKMTDIDRTVTGVYDLPYRLKSGAIIDRVDRNGTIYMTFDNRSVILSAPWSISSATIPGGRWGSPITSVVTVNESLNNVTYEVRYLTYWSYENLGLQNKS